MKQQQQHGKGSQPHIHVQKNCDTRGSDEEHEPEPGNYFVAKQMTGDRPARPPKGERKRNPDDDRNETRGRIKTAIKKTPWTERENDIAPELPMLLKRGVQDLHP